MDKLSSSRRASVLTCLVEGNSIASTTRITGVSKNAVLKLIVQAGEAFAEYQDRTLRHLTTEVLQLDEIWSFVGCKDSRLEKAKLSHPGSVWTWTAICADTKLVPSFYVSQERGLPAAMAFCRDLAKRFASTPRIISDGLHAYKFAIAEAFDNASYAQLVKCYKKGKGGRKFCASVKRTPVCGEMDEKEISTSYMERANLTMRMGNRRFTRLTNGHSKSMQNHVHMASITFMHYNFCRRHEAIRTTPAVAAGVACHPLVMLDLISVIDQYEETKREMAFDQAFSQWHWQQPRRMPKTYAPKPRSEMKTPWYLDVDKCTLSS